MVVQRIAGFIGGGLLSSSVLLIIFWALMEPLSYLPTVPALLIAPGLGYVLLGLLPFVMGGFALALVTKEEAHETYYLRYGVFLSIALILAGALYGAKASGAYMATAGFYQRFMTFLITDIATLVIFTAFCSIGYALGWFLKKKMIAPTAI